MLLNRYFKNELFIGSFLLLIFMNIANLLNYLFHFIMGRMLGPEKYGILAVLTSIIYIFMVPTTAIQTLVSKHTTRLNVKKKFGNIKGMLKILLIEASILSAVLFVLFLLCSLFLSDLLKIDYWLLALTGLFIFGAFLLPIGTGILQGMKKFSAWGLNSALNGFIKLLFGVILVYLGFSTYGAVLGFIMGMIIAFILIFPYIKEITNSKEIKEKIAIISNKNIALLGSILIITLIYSLDIIFAKAYFPADVAGQYSVVSMIGKIILFAAASISGAMFPISSERFFKRKNDDRSLIRKTFLIIGFLCALAIIAIILFPKLIIGILFGNAYVQSSDIIVYIAIAFSFISLTNTFILYKLSVSEFRIRNVLLLAFFLILEIVSFTLFNSSIKIFSIGFMISAIITFFGVLFLIGFGSKNG